MPTSTIQCGRSGREGRSPESRNSHAGSRPRPNRLALFCCWRRGVTAGVTAGGPSAAAVMRDADGGCNALAAAAGSVAVVTFDSRL